MSGAFGIIYQFQSTESKLMILAIISSDAIFGAVVSVGAMVLAQVFWVGKISATLTSAHKENTSSIKEIKDELKDAKISEIKSRVDDLWEDRQATWHFLRERGDAEVLAKKMGVKNSPISIDGTDSESQIVSVYQPLMPKLLKLEKDSGLDCRKESDEDVLWKLIAMKMSDELISTVCPILGVYSGGCVSLALSAMRKYKKQFARTDKVNESRVIRLHHSVN